MIGGGGTYAIIGARMWLPAEQLGIVVDRGNDWPSEVSTSSHPRVGRRTPNRLTPRLAPQIQTALTRFGPAMWHFRENPTRPTTRALNRYTGEKRDFEYLTERTRLEPRDFPPAMRTATWIHYCCSPTRAKVVAAQLDPPLNPTLEWQPNRCFEPIPDRCVPAEMDSLREVLPGLAVFSPNHEEAWAFYGAGVDEVARRGKDGVEEVARKLRAEGARGHIVIRSGAWGAWCVDRNGTEGWVDAYHTDASRVVDVTGAGNSFLGGLMAGLELYPDDLFTACRCAAISASFIIEQFGLPSLTSDAATGAELWNGSSPRDRLAEMSARSSNTATSSI